MIVAISSSAAVGTHSFAGRQQLPCADGGFNDSTGDRFKSSPFSIARQAKPAAPSSARLEKHQLAAMAIVFMDAGIFGVLSNAECPWRRYWPSAERVTGRPDNFLGWVEWRKHLSRKPHSEPPAMFSATFC
jgi:hypothetical protein